MKKPKHKCPHCCSTMTIRSSIQQHPLLRTIYMQCLNYKCGFSAGGNIEITHQISPSMIPNPTINLKTLDQISAARKAANDENKEAEEDG